MTCYHSPSLYPISLAYVHLPLMVNSFGLSNDEYALTIYGLLIHGILYNVYIEGLCNIFLYLSCLICQQMAAPLQPS